MPEKYDTLKRLREIDERRQRLYSGGLVPPQAVDAEEALLGAMLIDKGSQNRAFSMIGPRTSDDSPFYREGNSLIYFAMLSLADRQEGIDLLTVKNELLRMNALDKVRCGSHPADGGHGYFDGVDALVYLTTHSLVTTVNVESYIRTILDKHMRRKIIEISERGKLAAYDNAGELLGADIADWQMNDLMDAVTDREQTGAKHARAAWDELWKEIQTPAPDGMRGIPTGIFAFDDMMGGIRFGEETVVAALTSRGKTAFATQVAREHMDRGGWVFVTSLETKATKLLLRILAAEMGIENRALERGDLSTQEFVDVKQAIQRLKGLPLYIDDSGSRTPFDIRTELRRVASKQKGQGLVIFDYLQLIGGVGKFESREREVTTVNRQLRAMVKDFDVANLTLSQFNRGAKDDREPSMSDLRESGAIEQDARSIIFLHYPYRNEDPVVRRVEPVALILAKNDGGQVGKVECDFHKHLCRFTEHGSTLDSVAMRRQGLTSVQPIAGPEVTEDAF
ncbi:hypothetical protein KGP36_01725 [Patescibacteria group bacterium]|nr:hypothetical protein [Patescibacteria group bacterium]